MNNQATGHQIQGRDVTVFAVDVLEVKLSRCRIDPACLHGFPGLLFERLAPRAVGYGRTWDMAW